MVKLYAERDLEMLDMANNYYSRHVMAMTGEGLNSKSSIAAELAYRDWIIDEQQKELQKYKDQFPDYVECANCGSVTHVEGVEDAKGQSGCRIGEHDWVLDADEDYFVCRSCGETT